jgi:aminoglycoside phosphotransferase
MRLPAEVLAAAESALGTRRFGSEFAWMSWAGTVWRLGGDSGAVFVKRAADLAGERDRLAWLAGRLPVPEVVGFVHAYGDDWLLTRELSGIHLYNASLGWDPERVARRFGEILREIHATDGSGCPFGEEAPGHVLIHGDYCLPNVLVEARRGAGPSFSPPGEEAAQGAGGDGGLAGLVDVGRAGLGDARDDLAAGVWTLHYNYGHGFAPAFVDAYGAPPMTAKEIEALRRRYARPHKGKTVSTARQQYHAATER